MSDFNSTFSDDGVKGFTYRFTHGLAEDVYECDTCGALVAFDGVEKHANRDKLLNVLFNSDDHLS